MVQITLIKNNEKYNGDLLEIITSLKPMMDKQLDIVDQVILDAFIMSATKTGLTQKEFEASKILLKRLDIDLISEPVS